MKPANGIFIFLCLLVTAACTKSPRWTAGEWLGEGQPPLPSSVSKPIYKTAFKSGQLEFLSQQVAGIPVEGSFAKLVIARHAKVPETGRPTSWARYKYVEPADLPDPKLVSKGLKRKQISMEIAKGSFPKPWCKNLDRSLKEAQPELRWIGSTWRIVFHGTCEGTKGQNYEFAVSDQGALIEFQQSGSTFTGDPAAVEVNATLYPNGPKSSTLSALKIILSKQPNYLFNPLLNILSDSGAQISDLDQVPGIKPADPRFDLLQVYFYSNSALTWMTKTFAFQPERLKIRTHVGHPEATNAAFYFQREIRLGTGDGKAFSHLAWDPSIVIHEVMHSAIDSLIRLPFKGEGGSLNEGLADSLTAIHLKNPRMGENAYKNGPYQRTLENTATLAQRNGGLYADSLILSGTIWQISQETSPSFALSLIENLLAYLVPISDFDDAQALIRKWHSELSPSPQRDSIEAILKQRGWI